MPEDFGSGRLAQLSELKLGVLREMGQWVDASGAILVLNTGRNLEDSHFIAKNLKCNVLVYDYSGYGESGGIPMEKNTYRDIKQVYEWVVSNVTNHESNVVLYGQSVGSGPSCYLASRRENVGGLILHSPFTSGMRVLTPSRALACLDIFPNIDRIKKVNCKVFIIHGKKDAEVAFEHG